MASPSLGPGASEKEYTKPLLKLERISKLGRLGEELVAERLRHHGFTNIENLKSSAPQLSVR